MPPHKKKTSLFFAKSFFLNEFWDFFLDFLNFYDIFWIFFWPRFEKKKLDEISRNFCFEHSFTSKIYVCGFCIWFTHDLLMSYYRYLLYKLPQIKNKIQSVLTENYDTILQYISCWHITTLYYMLAVYYNIFHIWTT